MPGGIGTTAYKVKLEEHLKKKAADLRSRLHEAYEQQCKSHRVPFEWLAFEGDPIGALYLATETRDLVITGHDTAFRGNIRERLSETLAKLLLVTPRPTKLAIAISTAPRRSALIVTTNSGREVAPAINRVPTKVVRQPIASASSTPMNGSQVPAPTTMAPAIK